MIDRSTHSPSHIVAGIIALLFGVFGIHKFYLGYFNTGFIMLATTIAGGFVSLGIAASVVWLIGIIEGVIYLTMPQVAFDETYIQKTKEWF